MAGAVIEWLRGQPVADLETVAAADADVAGAILRQYRPYLRLARAVGRTYWTALAAADTGTWERLLGRVLAAVPAQGAVCWRHKPWFFRQLTRARDLFIQV